MTARSMDFHTVRDICLFLAMKTRKALTITDLGNTISVTKGERGNDNFIFERSVEMKNKLLFLMMTMGLFCLGLSATTLGETGVNFVPNPVFELDASQNENLTPRLFNDIYDWNTWSDLGGNGDISVIASDHPDFPLHAELRNGSIWTDGNAYELIKADTIYFIECDIKSTSGPGAIAAVIFETLPDWENDTAVEITAPDSGWGRVGGSLDTSDPANAAFIGKSVGLGVRPDSEEYSGTSTVAVTNLYFGEGRSSSPPVHTPSPADGAEGVPADHLAGDPNTTTLSWLRDATLDDAGRVIAPQPKVAIYWGERDDPNFWGWTNAAGGLTGGGEPTMIMALSDVNSLDLGDAIGGPIHLEPREYYYWAAKYEDPNSDPNLAPALIKTSTWSFDTFNKPPVVDAGLHYDMWQDGVPTDITIGIDASYSDDGNPAGGNLTYAWTETLSGGATTPTYPDGRNVEDPNVIFSEPGDYVLTLTIHDDEGGEEDLVGQDSTLIRIFANDEDRLRVHLELDESTGSTAADSDNVDPCDTHNGTLQDNPVWQPASGQVGGAIELDGTDNVDEDGFGDFISIDDTGSDPNLEADTWENSDLIDGMTISVWMKLDDNGWSTAWETLVGKSTDSWELLRNGSGDNIGIGIKGGIGSAVSSGVDVSSGWHQIVAVYDRNTVKLYINAFEVGSVPAGTIDLDTYIFNDQIWQIPKTAGKILIGNTNNPSINPDLDTSFGGLIDQVRIFDAAIPRWAQHPGTPGIVEMFRADGGHSCGGQFVPGDHDQSCYVTLGDFALVALEFLSCYNINDPACD